VGPGLTFQPSELVKLATIVLLAAWLSRPDVSPRSLTRGLAASVLVVLLAVAPVIQEDFGTALLIVVAAGSVMLLAGVPAWSLLLLAAGGAAAFYLLVSRDASRMARIHALFDPWSTTNPAAYQPRQSLIALLNGGWTGRGLGRGVTKLGFLPEDTTDFIFSVYVEETGLIGALLLLGLILAWIWHARRASVYAPDRFGMLLAGGVGVMVAVQALLHVAVDLVVLPPTGMGLPFVSAGGSAMVIMAAGVALTVAVTARSDPGGGGLR
jgi:cell division protein FtsW